MLRAALFALSLAAVGTLLNECEGLVADFQEPRTPRRRRNSPRETTNPPTPAPPGFAPSPSFPVPSVNAYPIPIPVPNRFPGGVGGGGPSGVGGRRLQLNNNDPEQITEVNRTLDLIEHNGPFPFRQDGVVFQNRENRLPLHERGYYHEYTVITPGLTHRGARRIITGTYPEIWYTNDHYRSFFVIDPRRYPR